MIDICELTDRALWDAFVEKEAPHTFLHSWEWGVFQERIGTPVARFGAYRDGRLVAAALVLKIRAKRGSFLFCPHGPIIDQNSDSLEILKELTASLERIARGEGFAFIRISPILTDTPEHRDLFTHAGYRPAPIHMHPELAWILDLTPSESDLLSAMRKTTRGSIKKAERDGVTVSQGMSEADLTAFSKIYDTTVKRQHFTPFSPAYFKEELSLFSERGRAGIFIGRIALNATNTDPNPNSKFQIPNSLNQESVPVSTAFIIFDQNSGYYHHGASSQAYPKIPASHLVLWTAILEAKRRGCHSFNFWGISPEDQPHHPW
ncbi:MAG: peptidoglycan bridge formation glycyltransferase FemA/FemB family protein, partial [Candidatus Shapirobacteria bacterium]